MLPFIAKYTAYFHDGSLIDIQYAKGYLRMSLESAEINEGEIQVEDEPFLTTYLKIRKNNVVNFSACHRSCYFGRFCTADYSQT